jgi:hypothetical protein
LNQEPNFSKPTNVPYTKTKDIRRMILRKSYYKLKPIIPRSLQIALRRQIARRKLKSASHIWPIDPEAGKTPQGWNGWPDQKRFALVLSHDVDRAKGLERCLQLMDLEQQLGFRSSFNFVPEGYEIPKQVLKTLQGSGFSIGVHGLVHDEKLFGCRKVFERRAPRINNYIKEWGAVGFHSPAMIRNLDWIGELDIEYDGSTFDTDPFEPQPEGVRTIFPFLVKRNSAQPLTTADRRRPFDFAQGLEGLERQTADRRIPRKGEDRRHPSSSVAPLQGEEPPEPGTQHHAPSTQNQVSSSQDPEPSTLNPKPNFYVELPYTLPQDHCLFVILREKNIRIWKEKLDWIAEKGGMALLNSHPDYMKFENGNCCLEEYPVQYYVELLEYVKKKYEGQYWHALASEVAEFWWKNMSHHCTGPECTELKFDDSI